MEFIDTAINMKLLNNFLKDKLWADIILFRSPSSQIKQYAFCENTRLTNDFSKKTKYEILHFNMLKKIKNKTALSCVEHIFVYSLALFSIL